jgi:hypothetical protein
VARALSQPTEHCPVDEAIVASGGRFEHQPVVVGQQQRRRASVQVIEPQQRRTGAVEVASLISPACKPQSRLDRLSQLTDHLAGGRRILLDADEPRVGVRSSSLAQS